MCGQHFSYIYLFYYHSLVPVLPFYGVVLKISLMSIPTTFSVPPSLPTPTQCFLCLIICTFLFNICQLNCEKYKETIFVCSICDVFRSLGLISSSLFSCYVFCVRASFPLKTPWRMATIGLRRLMPFPLKMIMVSVVMDALLCHTSLVFLQIPACFYIST